MIKSIQVANIGPFRGEQSVEFGTGLLSIEGRYTDKEGESNRAGKSALIELMRFGLYGVHRHRVLADYVNRAADSRNEPVYVSLELTSKDDPSSSVHIIREFDPGLQRFGLRIPELEETFSLKQQDLQTYIEQNLVGCNYENAQQTWMVLQDDAKGIMRMSVNDRKKFLLDLFAPQAYPWDAYYAEANSRLNICKTRQQEILSRITNLRNRLLELSGQDFNALVAQAKQQISELQARKVEITQRVKELNAAASPEALEKMRRSVTSEKQKLNDMYNALLLSRKTLEKMKRDSESFNIKSRQLAELKAQLQTLQKKAKGVMMDKIEADYSRVYNEHKELATKLAIDLQQYRNVDQFNGVCPVTHHECSSGADVCHYRAELEKVISENTTKVDNLQSKLDELVVKMDANDALKKDINVVEANIQAVELTLSHLENALELYANQQEQNAKDEETYRQCKAAVDKMDAEYKARVNDHDITYQRRIRELKSEYQVITTQIKEAESRMTTLIADEQRKKTFEEDLADAQREFDMLGSRITALQSLRPMLSTSGVPFYYLLASISEFERSINSALAGLGTDMSIEVEPYTITKSLEPICHECGFEYAPSSRVTTCPNPMCGAQREYKKRETLEIRMKGRAYDVNFEEDSGGGQQWVSMGVRFALFNLLRERGLMGNVDFWCLDEVFAPLSEVSKFNMLNFLETICNTYGIKQLFLITHTDISAVVPPAVIIERSDSKQESYIKY